MLWSHYFFKNYTNFIRNSELSLELARGLVSEHQIQASLPSVIFKPSFRHPSLITLASLQPSLVFSPKVPSIDPCLLDFRQEGQMATFSPTVLRKSVWVRRCPSTVLCTALRSLLNQGLVHTRVWRRENKSRLFQDFLLLSAVLRLQWRFQNLRQTPVRTQTPVETLFVYGSKRWKPQFWVDSQLRTQLTKQPPQSSIKGNFYVRVRFRGVSSTVEEVVRVRFRCLLSWKTNRGNTGRTVLGHCLRGPLGFCLFRVSLWDLSGLFPCLLLLRNPHRSSWNTWQNGLGKILNISLLLGCPRIWLISLGVFKSYSLKLRRNYLEKSFSPKDFEGADPLKNYEK